MKLLRNRTYLDLLDQISYWRKRAKFVLRIPTITIDGESDVQIYCKDQKEVEKIHKLLKDGIKYNASK